MTQAESILGTKFGRWTVLSVSESRAAKPRVLCKCECGTERSLYVHALCGGTTRSCGCLAAEQCAARKTTHGKSNTPLFGVWCGIVKRCTKPGEKDFPRYGGRGITLCERWHDFAAFEQDMGAGYASGLQIDRIDNDAGYAPSNCRWVDRKTNMRNRRVTVCAEWDGRRMPLVEIAERCGVRPKALRYQFSERGLPIGMAVDRAIELEARR